MNTKSYIAFGIGCAAVAFAAALFLPAMVLAWNLQGACAGAPTTARVGDMIAWTATQTSTLQTGQGHYEWSWSGADGLSGATQSVSKTYATPGVKNATVLIKLALASGKIESITRSCSVTITTPPPPELTGSCAATPGSGTVGSSFTWSASASGGTGSYTYSWAGDDGLSGTSQSVTKSYLTAGAKNGTVVITSGSESILRSCSVTVTATTTETPFDGMCTVSSATASIGETIQWGSSASGGTGTYAYSWSGDEGLTGMTDTLTKAYGSAGTKLGAVTITSGSQSVTKTCAVFITPPPGCTSGCGGGWNQPNVILLKKATSTTLASASVYLSQTPRAPASASIYLSQIPYTGIVEDSVKTIAYIVLLLAITGIISYLLVSSRKKSDKHLFKQPMHLVEITGSETPRAKQGESEVAGATDTQLFISWLVAGESQKVFEHLRALNGRGADTAAFVTNLASELDFVYRNRIDARAAMPPEKTKKSVEGWSNEWLEEVISILVDSVDESYRSNDTPIKLAMAKIMKLGA